jgi:hypothetical protein
LPARPGRLISTEKKKTDVLEMSIVGLGDWWGKKANSIFGWLFSQPAVISTASFVKKRRTPVLVAILLGVYFLPNRKKNSKPSVVVITNYFSRVFAGSKTTPKAKSFRNFFLSTAIFNWSRSPRDSKQGKRYFEI